MVLFNLCICVRCVVTEEGATAVASSYYAVGYGEFGHVLVGHLSHVVHVCVAMCSCLASLCGF